ncbi:MAG: hypothetical protein QNK05_05365 [Myxococcota bacterium]|nr:hypothetical protein [Myxococcota bacterium]
MRKQEPALFWIRVILGVALIWLLVIVIGGDPMDGVPKREAAGKTVRPVDYWRTQGWYVAAVESVIVAVLLITSRFWVRLEPARRFAALDPPAPPGRAFVVLVAAAVLASAVLAWPRMDQSFWDDEEYNIVRSIDGSYEKGPDGSLRFREADLRDTLWWFQSPNNHVPHTILVKTLVRGWKAVARPDSLLVPEPLARAPAFVAGLLAIVSAALLSWRIGFERAGILAAWIIALHPWHLKYTSEARGYTLVMLAMTAMPWLFLRVLHHGTWGRYAVFGAAQFLLLWVNSAQAFHMVLLNAALGLSLLWLHRERLAEAVAPACRWISVAVMGGLLWVLLMTPNLMQTREYMEHTRGVRDLGKWWIQTVGSHLAAGMTWSQRGRGDGRLYPELVQTATAHPVVVWGMVGVAVVAMLGGALRVARRGGPAAYLPFVMLITPPLTYGVAFLQQANAYTWYLVFAVPTLALLVAWGLEGLLAAARGRLVPTLAASAVLAAWLGAFGFVTEWPRESLRERSWKPGKESVLLTRPSLDPNDPPNAEILTATFCSENLYYDPLATRLEEATELEALMRRADAEGKALYVNAGRLFRQQKYWTEMLALLEERFEVVDTLYGYEPPWTRRVWRYRGAAAAAEAEPVERGGAS